jgi:dihydrofolate reductase
MTRVLWHTTMSLDGFIAPPDDTTDWMFGHGHAGPMGAEVIERTGAILAGRRGFDLSNVGSEGERATYGGAWSGPMFVLTHRPADPAPDVTFLSGDIGDAVSTARRAAGARDVGVFGADIARQCVLAGLVDDILIHLVPVLLGDGVRLFSQPGLPPIQLDRTRCSAPSQITDLSFAVRHPDPGP